METWPFEAILAVIERGTLPDWRRLARAMGADPFGPVARQVEEALRISRPYGTAELLESVTEKARADAAASERAAVAEEIRQILEASGLDRGSFAERIGTSTSRLSTYLSGSVTPSAALMVRMRRVAGARP